MSTLDLTKCGEMYEYCPKCRHKDFDDYEKCQFCIRTVSKGYDFTICGIPVGTGICYLHQNFEPLEG